MEHLKMVPYMNDSDYDGLIHILGAMETMMSTSRIHSLQTRNSLETWIDHLRHNYCMYYNIIICRL